MDNTPLEIEPIFDRPGAQWTDAERDRIIEWLFEPQQGAFLLFKGLYYVGTPQNAEDAWEDFCIERLDNKIKQYDPAKGFRFWSYLCNQFQYFCRDKRKKLDKRGKREPGVELEVVDEGLTPQEIIEQKELLNALQKCVSKLTLGQQEVVQRFYFQELSISEIAQELGINEVAIKVRLHRARNSLRNCLKGKRWLS